MAAKRKKNACVVCGKNPAEGWAWIDTDRYCHGDDDPEPTCYMRGQSALVTRGHKHAVRYRNVVVDHGDPPL